MDKRVVVIVGLLLLLGGPQARAAKDDVAFDQCLQAFKINPGVMKGVAWHATPLPAPVEKVVEVPDIEGWKIVRWTSHHNEDGTTSYIILTRDPDRNRIEDDPDLFELVLERHNFAKITDYVASNAVVFSKKSSQGVAGVQVCSRGGPLPYPPFMWNGHHWATPTD